MENGSMPPEQPIVFPECIGQDFELWEKYHEVYGPEAYKYRRLFEVTAQQLDNLYTYAHEHSIELPNPGPDFT